MIKKKQLTFLLIFFFSSFGYSQEAQFINFTTKDGLPSNEVYNVFQDKNGCMWFATDRGLSQYNGYNFKSYTPKDGLADICVFEFFPQENNQIWCTTFSKKIFYFDNGTNKFIPFKYNDQLINFTKKNKLKMFIIKDLFVNKHNDVFISNGWIVISIDRNGHVREFCDLNVKKLPVRFLNEVSISNENKKISYASFQKSSYTIGKDIIGLDNIVDINTNLKLIINNGFASLIEKGKETNTINKDNTYAVSGWKFNDKQFWVGYKNNGVKFYDNKGNFQQHLLPKYTVTHLITDSYNGLWITTADNGVYYLPSTGIKTYPIKDNIVHSLSVNEKKMLYIATTNGNVYSLYADKFIQLNSSTMPFSSCVQYFEKEKKLYSFYDKNLYINEIPFSKNTPRILKFSDDNKDIFSFSQYYTVATLKDSKIEMDTLDYRVNDLSYVDNTFYLATLEGLKIKKNGIVSEVNKGLLSSRMDDIDYDYTKKVFYIATLGRGLFVYDKKKVVAIDKSKGLSDDLATEVYIENQNTVWVCTNNGLNRIQFFSPTKYKIDYITSSNGLISNQVKDIEIIDETIYIATTGGLCSLTKKQFNHLLAKKNYFLQLKNCRVKNKTVELINGKLDLNYNQNKIDFTVEAVSFIVGKKISYHYKMDGLDDKWNSTQERTLTYEYLPSGDYELQVRVFDDGRNFSDECIKIPIHIGKPFWKTYWFLGILMLLMGTIVYLFFKIRVLTYNKDMTREILRLIIKRFKRKDDYFTFKEAGKTIRIHSESILYVKSSGNYIDVVTLNKTYTVREKLSNFIDLVPDHLEFLRIHRSYVIRIDKVEQKTKKSVFINKEEIQVGETYISELDKIVF